MNTYKFVINAVDAHVSQDGLDNVIYNVHYSYWGETASGKTTSLIGVQSVAAPDAENFVPYEQLTQADVIAWIEPELPIEDYQANLDSQLAELETPTKVTLHIPLDTDNQSTEGTVA